MIPVFHFSSVAHSQRRSAVIGPLNLHPLCSNLSRNLKGAGDSNPNLPLLQAKTSDVAWIDLNLISACKLGNLKDVISLVAAGANVNAKDVVGAGSHEDGWCWVNTLGS